MSTSASNKSKCNSCINEDSCLFLDITSCCDSSSSSPEHKCCHSSRVQLLVKERDELKAQLDRIQEELAVTSREKHQSAELGLELLDQKEELQKRYDDLEVAYDGTRCELEALRTALAKSQTSQKVSATTGIEQEETLLKESAKKEATFASALAELERELKSLRAELDRVKSEKERLLAEHCDMAKQLDLHEWERKNMRCELKDLKLRESRLLQEMNELEDENISLRKQVSSLRSSQIEFESAKHEIIRLQEELELRRLQVEEFESVKNSAEKQMREALEALESEREQKYELKKKLDERMNFDSALGSFGLRFSSSHSSRKCLKDSSNCTLNSVVTPAKQLIVNGSSASSSSSSTANKSQLTTGQHRARSSCTSSSSFTYFDGKMNLIRDSFLNSKTCNSTSQQEQTRSFSSEVIASSLSTSSSAYICSSSSSSFISSSPFLNSNTNGKCCSNNGKEISKLKSESNCKLHSVNNCSNCGPTTGSLFNSRYDQEHQLGNNKFNRKTEFNCNVYSPSSSSSPPPHHPPPACQLLTAFSPPPSSDSSSFCSSQKFNLLSPSSLTSVTLTSGNSSASSTSTYPLSVTPASNSSSSYINSPLSSSLYSTSNSTSTSSPISMAVNSFTSPITNNNGTDNNNSSSNSVPSTSTIVNNRSKDATDATSSSSSSSSLLDDPASLDATDARPENAKVNCNGASDEVNCNSESNNSSISCNNSSVTCCNSNNGSSSCSSYHTCCSTFLPSSSLCPQEQGQHSSNQKSPSAVTCKLNEIQNSNSGDASQTSGEKKLMSSSSDITFCEDSTDSITANASTSLPSSLSLPSMSEVKSERKLLPFKKPASDEDGEKVATTSLVTHSQSPSSDHCDQVTSLPCESTIIEDGSHGTMQTGTSLLSCDDKADRTSFSDKSTLATFSVGGGEVSQIDLHLANEDLSREQKLPGVANGSNCSSKGDININNGAKDDGICRHNTHSNCGKANSETSPQHRQSSPSSLAGTSIVSPRDLIESIGGQRNEHQSVPLSSAPLFVASEENGRRKSNLKISSGYESQEICDFNFGTSYNTEHMKSRKEQRKLTNSARNGCKRPKSLITEYKSSHHFTTCNSNLNNYFTGSNSVPYSSSNFYFNNNSGPSSLTSEILISKSPEFTLPVIDLNHKSTKIESNLPHQQSSKSCNSNRDNCNISKSICSSKLTSKVNSNNSQAKKATLRLTNSDFYLLGMQNSSNQFKNSYPFSSDQLNSTDLNCSSREAVKSFTSLTFDSMVSNYLGNNSLTPISVESLNSNCDSHLTKDKFNCKSAFHMNNKYSTGNCSNNLLGWEKDSGEVKSKLKSKQAKIDPSGCTSEFENELNRNLNDSTGNDCTGPCVIGLSKETACNLRLSPVSLLNCNKPTLRRKLKLISGNRCCKVKSIHPLNSASSSSLNKKSFFIVLPGQRRKLFITSSNKGGPSGTGEEGKKNEKCDKTTTTGQLRRKFIIYSNSCFSRKSTSALWSHRVSSGKKKLHIKTTSTNSGVASEPDYYSSELDHLNVPSVTVMTALSNLTRSGSLDSDIDSHQATCTSSGSGNSSVDCNHHSAVLFDHLDACGVVNCEASKKANELYATVLPRKRRQADENVEEDEKSKLGPVPNGPFGEVSPGLENVVDSQSNSSVTAGQFSLVKCDTYNTAADDGVLDLKNHQELLQVVASRRSNINDTDVSKKEKNTRHIRHLAVAVTDASAKLLIHQSHENSHIEGEQFISHHENASPGNSVVNESNVASINEKGHSRAKKKQIKESNENVQQQEQQHSNAGKGSNCSSVLLMRKSVTHETALNSNCKLKTKSPAIATINTHDFEKIDKFDGLSSLTDSAKSTPVRLNSVRAISESFHDNLNGECDTNSSDVKVALCSEKTAVCDSSKSAKSKTAKSNLQVATRSSNVCVSALKATVRVLAGCFLGLFAP